MKARTRNRSPVPWDFGLLMLFIIFVFWEKSNGGVGRGGGLDV
jgi:hypothetical protein